MQQITYVFGESAYAVLATVKHEHEGAWWVAAELDNLGTRLAADFSESLIGKILVMEHGPVLEVRVTPLPRSKWQLNFTVRSREGDAPYDRPRSPGGAHP